MVMENGFCSPRSDAFPAGLRVLVVDDDPTWLKILERMLKKCSYEVTTCGLASEALKLLRDRKDGFDIVISDVNMPDMDGFKLLEHVGLEMDLPVIMMSVDGETSRVMKGVQHGACDYLLKPIRMKELKNIWQHVVRKKMNEVRDIECIDDRIGPNHFPDGHFGGEQNLIKKRKDVDNKYDEKDTNDPSATKKARVVWTVELHQKFVRAVDQLGIDSDRIGPKKILDLMNVPWLTRENVASHLQKYRLYLSRLRKEEDKLDSSCGGVKNPATSPKESSGSFGLQNSTFGQLSDISSEYMYKGNQLPVQTVDSNPESSNLLPLTEHRVTFSPDSHKVKSSPLSLNHTVGSLDMSAKHTSFDPWSGEASDVQFEPEFKPHLKLDNCFNQPTVAILHQHINQDLLEPPSQTSPPLIDLTPLIGHDVLETAPQIGSHLIEPAPHISSGPSISDANHLGLIDRKPSQAEGQVANHSNEFSVSEVDAYGVFSQELSSVIEQQPLLEKPTHSIPIHSGSELIDEQGLETGFGAIEMKRPSSCQGSAMVQSTKYEPRNQMLVSEPASGTLGDDMMSRWIQCGDNTSKDVGYDCNFLEHESLYVPKFDTEYPIEWGEYPFDHGILFS